MNLRVILGKLNLHVIHFTSPHLEVGGSETNQ